MDKQTAYMLGKAFKLGMIYAKGKAHARKLTTDKAEWITVHPNGKENKGRPALIDSTTGQVLGGMGGKFNGKHISVANNKSNKPALLNNQKFGFSQTNKAKKNNPIQTPYGNLSTKTQKRLNTVKENTNKYANNDLSNVTDKELHDHYKELEKSIQAYSSSLYSDNQGKESAIENLYRKDSDILNAKNEQERILNVLSNRYGMGDIEKDPNKRPFKFLLPNNATFGNERDNQIRLVLNKAENSNKITKSENNQPAEKNQKAMTEQEYLASKGVGGAFSDYMLDKVRTNPNRTERAKKRFSKEADQARNDYFDKREQARKEYQEKISNGELRNKTPLEQRLEKAQGHEDNASTQSARRLLEKQGIDWRTGKALNAKGEETLRKYNQTVNNQPAENQTMNKQNKVSFNGYDFDNISEAKDFLYDAEKNIRGHKEDIATNTTKLKQANKDLAKLQTLDRFYQDYKKDNPLFEKSFTEYLKDNKANYKGIKANELPDLRSSKYWGGGYQDSERAINTLKNAYERVSDNLKRKNTEIRDLNRDIEYARERIPRLQKLIKIGNETISKLEK